jgi:hypothetical protein
MWPFGTVRLRVQIPGPRPVFEFKVVAEIVDGVMRG